MVGNDPANDIEAARRAGLPAYQITANQGDTLNGPHGPIGSGWLDGFFPWLDSLSPAALEPDFTAPEAILKILRSTPAALYGLTGSISLQQPGQQAWLPPAAFPPSLSPAAWTTRPAEGAWSITEIVCHLRDVDGEVNLPRIRNILQVKNPFLMGMNTDLWAEERHYIRQDGREALYQFTQHRLELLAILEKFSSEDWKRPARHAIFGPSQLQELIGIIAGHDRLHVRQVRENLAALNVPTVNLPE
jgi:hypothetical protein